VTVSFPVRKGHLPVQIARSHDERRTPRIHQTADTGRSLGGVHVRLYDQTFGIPVIPSDDVQQIRASCEFASEVKHGVHMATGDGDRAGADTLAEQIVDVGRSHRKA
jgi:hypothetical protein